MNKKLDIQIDGPNVVIYVNGEAVWSGSVTDWSFAISHPISTEYKGIRDDSTEYR